jgi:hypothetical protein
LAGFLMGWVSYPDICSVSLLAAWHRMSFF